MADDTVVMKKSEIDALTAEVKRLSASIEKMEGDGIANTNVLRKITTRTVTVRRIDGKVVVGFRNKGTEKKPTYVYEKVDPRDPNKRVWYVDVLLEGMEDEKALAIDFKEFLSESERVTCPIVNTEEREWMIEQGVVKKREVDGYSMVELNFDVPVEVVGKTRWFTVALPDQDKRQVRVHEGYVNM